MTPHFDWTINIGNVGSILTMVIAAVILIHKHQLAFELLQQTVTYLRDAVEKMDGAAKESDRKITDLDKRVAIVESRDRDQKQ